MSKCVLDLGTSIVARTLVACCLRWSESTAKLLIWPPGTKTGKCRATMFAFLSVDTAERRRWDETWYSQRYLPARFVHIDDGLAFLGFPRDLERSRPGPRADLAALNGDHKNLRSQASFFVRARINTEGAQLFGQQHGPLEDVLGRSRVDRVAVFTGAGPSIFGLLAQLYPGHPWRARAAAARKIGSWLPSLALPKHRRFAS